MVTFCYIVDMRLLGAFGVFYVLCFVCFFARYDLVWLGIGRGVVLCW